MQGLALFHQCLRYCCRCNRPEDNPKEKSLDVLLYYVVELSPATGVVIANNTDIQYFILTNVVHYGIMVIYNHISQPVLLRYCT